VQRCCYLFQKIKLTRSLLREQNPDSRRVKTNGPADETERPETEGSPRRRNWRNEEPMERNCLRCTTRAGGWNRASRAGRARFPTSLRHNKIARRKKKDREAEIAPGDLLIKLPPSRRSPSLFLSLAAIFPIYPLFPLFAAIRTLIIAALVAPGRSRRDERKSDRDPARATTRDFHSGDRERSRAFSAKRFQQIITFPSCPLEL